MPAASTADDVLGQLELLSEQLADHKLPLKLSELRDLFYRGAAQLVKAREVRSLLARLQLGRATP